MSKHTKINFLNPSELNDIKNNKNETPSDLNEPKDKEINNKNSNKKNDNDNSVLNSEKMKDEETKDRNKKVYFKLPKIIKRTGKKGNFKNNHEYCLYRHIDYYTLLK